MSADVAVLKRRLMVMLALDAVCLVMAIAAAVGAFFYGIAWLQWVFAAALAGGFGAQIWFIAGFRRATKGV
jgi:hypothetical protein